MHGSWAVLYTDGTRLAQYDEEWRQAHPRNGKVLDEVPYRAIDWSRVKQVELESQVWKSTLSVPEPLTGYRWSLRSRHYKTMTKGKDAEVMCFMLVQHPQEEEATATNVVQSFYWFPNGVTHTCTKFKCPDVNRYALQYVHGIERTGLALNHGQLVVQVDAELSKEVSTAV